MKDNIIFKSALGYWDSVLNKLFNGIEVFEWNISFDSFEKNGCPELNNECNKLVTISDKPTKEYLYIYIAPITWASRYQKNGFKVIGPAFGTNNSLSVFAGTYKYKKSNDNNKIKVGTIGKYITSTALFLVYHLFMEYIFNTNIHLLSRDGKIDEYEVDKIIFEFISVPQKSKRFSLLKNPEQDIDYAIFTIEDINELNLSNANNIREVLKVDPVLSHIFNIEFVPRTVYCIHESQLDLKDELEKFNNLLIANRQHYGKKIIVNESKTPTSIFPIDPEDINAKNVQNLILKYFKKMLELDPDHIPQEIIPKFDYLKYEDLTSLI